MIEDGMSQRIALLDTDGTVVNVAEFPDDWAGDTWLKRQAVPLDGEGPVGIGWTRTGDTFTPPPDRRLYASPLTITADDTTLVTYRDTYPDAPAAVTFTANGDTITVELTDGIAELEVTPSAPGPITVSVDQPVDPITITVEES